LFLKLVIRFVVGRNSFKGDWFCFEMRGVVFVLVFFVLSGICFADAFEAEVMLIDDIGSFSGAVLRIKASADAEVGDKIFPSEYLTSAGIIKFNIETSLPEVFLNIVIVKSGEVVANIDEGPFVVDGSQILIDRREGMEGVVVEEVVSEEDIVEDVVVENSTENVSDVSVSSNAENVPDVISENVYVAGESSSGNVFLFYIIGGTLTFIILMVMWFKFKTFRDWMTRINYFSEDSELARIENQIRKKDKLIDLIKEEKARKRKISLARKKLERETKKLEKMVRKKMKK